MNKYNFIDLTGNRFGKLVVIQKSKERGNRGQIKWDCKCDCGNIHTVSGALLRRGATKSCGCLRKNFISPNKIADRNDFLKRRLYKNIIVKRSKQINKEYNLSYDDFCELIKQPCFYCGAKNTNYIQDYSTRNGFISDTVIFYNGIDRVDNSLGYLKTNVVSCCKRCNSAKNDMSILEFNKWLSNVYNHYFIIKNEPYCDIAKNRIGNI